MTKFFFSIEITVIICVLWKDSSNRNWNPARIWSAFMVTFYQRLPIGERLIKKLDHAIDTHKCLWISGAKLLFSWLNFFVEFVIYLAWNIFFDRIIYPEKVYLYLKTWWNISVKSRCLCKNYSSIHLLQHRRCCIVHLAIYLFQKYSNAFELGTTSRP